MKKSTKIIIIVAVVAVAAFLVWKNRKKMEDVSSPETASGTGSMAYILSKIPFTNKEICKIKAIQNVVNSSATYLESMKKKAAQRGNTVDEQIVLDAIWVLYTKDGKWLKGPDGTSDYGYRLQQAVLNLQ